ncbi:hypothetical protein [Nocardioides plantarum]|uniref:Secreted protein n=1 Tax=Nocardioides plantarum TaxID=29299 RepID=A0ABV5KA54_9ACTN|nr:hypothetical protein [Nocardioides plantarum]
MSITPRRAALVAPLLLVATAFSGCGVADEQVRPGVAARVDGTDFSVSEVDDLTSGTCDYLDTTDNTLAYPRFTVRRLSLETLVRQEAAKHLLDDLDATLPDDYTKAVASLTETYAAAPADVAKAMREGDQARYFVAYAAAAVGNVLLREETGTEPADADKISARGNQAITTWIADHDVDLNPTFGLRLEDGTFKADDGLSVPVSTQARDASAVTAIDLSGATDATALQAALAKANASLPADQVCGTPSDPSTPSAPQG